MTASAIRPSYPALLARTLGTAFVFLRTLFLRVGAAQRCADSMELGRRPDSRDLDVLGIDAADLAPTLARA